LLNDEGKKFHARVTAPKPDSSPRIVVPRAMRRESVRLRKGGSDSSVNDGIYDSRVNERITGINEERTARGAERQMLVGVGERTKSAMDCGIRIMWMTSRAYRENWKFPALCEAERVFIAWHTSRMNNIEDSVNVHEKTILASI